MEVHTCPVYQLKKSGVTDFININTVREARKEKARLSFPYHR